MGEYYLGVDSGGTKAAFVLGDATGRVYARHRAAGHGVLEVGPHSLQDTLEEGIAAVCKAAGIQKGDIACMGLGIAGYGEAEGSERETLAACEAAIGAGRAVCECDCYVGWAGSFALSPGVNIISGTGSIVYGVNAAGESTRCSGWGAGCDEGSCTWLGQRLVQEFCKQSDGRLPRTKLYEMCRAHFGIQGEDVLFVVRLNVEVVRGHGLPELQRFLKEVYDAGDERAKAIYEEGARELWLGARAVARKLGMLGGAFTASYSGGLFNSGACAIEPLRALAAADGAALAQPRFGPEIGALFMAIRHKNPAFDVSRFALREGAAE